MKLSLLFPIGILFIGGLAKGQAQLVINSSNWSYLQDFDSLPSSNSDPLPTWANNSTLPGWYGFGHNAAAKTAIFASNGTTSAIANGGGNTPTLTQSIGTGSDRALGFYATGSSGNQYFLLSLQNMSGGTIDSLTISYSALKLANQAAALPLQLFYQISTDPFEPAGVFVTSDIGWTEISAMSYQPGTGVDSTPLSFTLDQSFNDFALEDGEYLMFRFKQAIGAETVVGIDNLQLAAIPEPTTVFLAGFGLLAWTLRRNVQKSRLH